jgi:hypothetical protein
MFPLSCLKILRIKRRYAILKTANINQKHKTKKTQLICSDSFKMRLKKWINIFQFCYSSLFALLTSFKLLIPKDVI